MGIRIKGFVIDDEKREIVNTLNSDVLQITPKNMELLLYFISNNGVTLTKDQIIADVWSGVVVSDVALARAVADLRKVFNDNPKAPHFIQTIPKKGYCFIASPEMEENAQAKLKGKSDEKIEETSLLQKSAGKLYVAIFVWLLVIFAYFVYKPTSNDALRVVDSWPSDFSAYNVLEINKNTRDDLFAITYQDRGVTSISLIDGKNKKTIKQIPLGQFEYVSTALHKNTLYFVGIRNGLCNIYQTSLVLKQITPTKIAECPVQRISKIIWSNTMQQYFLFSSRGTTLFRFDQDWNRLQDLEIGQRVANVSINDRNNWSAFTDRLGNVFLYDLESAQKIRKIGTLQGQVTKLDWYDDKSILAGIELGPDAGVWLLNIDSENSKVQILKKPVQEFSYLTNAKNIIYLTRLKTYCIEALNQEKALNKKCTPLDDANNQSTYRNILDPIFASFYDKEWIHSVERKQMIENFTSTDETLMGERFSTEKQIKVLTSNNETLKLYQYERDMGLTHITNLPIKAKKVDTRFGRLTWSIVENGFLNLYTYNNNEVSKVFSGNFVDFYNTKNGFSVVLDDGSIILLDNNAGIRQSISSPFSSKVFYEFVDEEGVYYKKPNDKNRIWFSPLNDLLNQKYVNSKNESLENSLVLKIYTSDENRKYLVTIPRVKETIYTAKIEANSND